MRLLIGVLRCAGQVVPVVKLTPSAFLRSGQWNAFRLSARGKSKSLQGRQARRMLSNSGCARSAFTQASLWAKAIAVVLVISALAYAQEPSTGNISGTVTGPRGEI